MWGTLTLKWTDCFILFTEIGCWFMYGWQRGMASLVCYATGIEAEGPSLGSLCRWWTPFCGWILGSAQITRVGFSPVCMCSYGCCSSSCDCMLSGAGMNGELSAAELL